MPTSRRAIGFLTGPEMMAAGRAENLTRLHDELIRKDWFQTLPDFNAYVVRKGQALSDYACDPLGWRRKCLVNIAKAGMFSSDRTLPSTIATSASGRVIDISVCLIRAAAQSFVQQFSYMDGTS